MAIIKKLFGKKKTDADLKAEVLKKATEHWNANNDSTGIEDKPVEKSSSVYTNIDEAKKQNIRTVLLEIAERGETGVLPVSISDKTGISQQDTATALDFLSNNKHAEAVNSPIGIKYYLTEAGRKYCLSKEFNTGF